MNKLRIAAVAFVLLVGSGVMWTGITHAQAFLSTTNPSQTINSSLYSAGRTVDIEGTINGDVYCAGQNVDIDATVHGDVLCAGQTVTVSGHIDGSLRVVAKDLIDQAVVQNSFSAVAHNAVITKDASVGTDVSFAGQTLAVNGRVGRDMAIRASTLNINGAVGRNVRYDGTVLNLWSKSRIAGSLDYASDQRAMVAQSAVIHGPVSHTVPTPKSQSAHAAFTAWAASFVYIFIALLFFGLIVVLFMPQVTRTVAEESADHLGRAILNAFGMLILEPIIIIVLTSLVVGIPLALVSIVLFLLLGLFSLPVTAYYIGTLLMSSAENAILTMVVGMFVLVILIMLPVVGLLAFFASYLIGSGGIILALRKYLPAPVYNVK